MATPPKKHRETSPAGGDDALVEVTFTGQGTRRLTDTATGHAYTFNPGKPTLTPQSIARALANADPESYTIKEAS